LSIILIFLSCAKKTQEEPAIIVDNINITRSEFDSAFNRSNFEKESSKEIRKDFLDNFINRKLILKEAQRQGLDKDQQFLNDIQDFWEQALIKITFDKKIKELFLTVKVSDTEINNFYYANKDKFGTKDLLNSYNEIKLLVLKEKQKKAINEWLDSLRKKAKIKINYKLLEIE
jgi:hypothetical protein